LIASVTFRVKIVVSGLPPAKHAIRDRAASKNVVASSASV
jgi:hypothetical protein